VVDGEAVMSLGSVLEVCILAGGLSTRMGRDKAQVRVGDMTMLARVRKTASGFSKIVSKRVRVLRKDRVRRCGPLGGIITGLRTTRARAVLFLACDMPLVSPMLLKQIMRASSTGAEMRAVFAAQSGRVGFPCLLPASSLELIEKQMTAEEFSLQALAEKLRARRIVVAAKNRELLNVNTSADIVLAEKLLLRSSKD
jgi:molybdopterin-guanine dinucleotide biosynthesis protein A